MGDTFVFGVIGGYGRIGTEVINTLLKMTDAEILAGGRNSDKCREHSSGCESRISYQKVDIHSDASLSLFCRKCHIVINCAGPSSTIFDKVARAALRHKIHYIDVGGSEALYNELLLREDMIRDNDTAFVVTSGMYPGLTEVFPAYIASGYFDEVESLEYYFAVNDHMTYSSAYDIVCGMLKNDDVSPSFYEDGQKKKCQSVSTLELELPHPVGKVPGVMTFNSDMLRIVENYNIKSARFYNIFSGERIRQVLFEIGMLKMLNKPSPKKRLAEILVNASNEDMRGRQSYVMLYLTMKGRGNGSPKAVTSTLYSEKAHKVSGIVAANMANSIKEGTYKGAGCFYLDEIVNVADFMSGLKHHELFSIKTETNL